MPQFAILGSFQRDAVASAVPPEYRPLVRHVTKDDVVYTVILFPHDRTHGGVSTSALVERALKRVPKHESLLAVGCDFTREATELLVVNGATIVRLGEFGWTDESYIGVRTPAR